MSTAAERAAQLDLVARLKSAYPELPDAPTPDLLERLRPTHVITQSQCEVCAVSLKDVEQALCQFTSSQPVVVSLEPNALTDVWSDIRRVAAALIATDRGY